MPGPNTRIGANPPSVSGIVGSVCPEPGKVTASWWPSRVRRLFFRRQDYPEARPETHRIAASKGGRGYVGKDLLATARGGIRSMAQSWSASCKSRQSTSSFRPTAPTEPCILLRKLE